LPAFLIVAFFSVAGKKSFELFGLTLPACLFLPAALDVPFGVQFQREV
jgi:hypothetical protein